MGRLLSVHACPVCNYHVEDQLHEGGSGIAVMFLNHRYVLALCGDCHNLVSILVRNTDEQTQEALKAARHDIVQMEADAVIGDHRARDLLPLFRQALDHFESDKDIVPTGINVCSVCGSANLQIAPDVDGSLFDAQDAWIQCPRCTEGWLLVETSGVWD